MTTQDQNFWRNIGSGMFDLGTGLYGMNAGQKEARQRVAAAQGPLYQSQTAGAQTALNRAGAIDPRAAGAEWLQGQQGLLAGKDAADEQAILRRLHATGMLGSAVYNPGVAGINPTGAAMNPQLAAYYAARGGRDAKMAAEAMDRGEGQIDRMINRSGMLSTQAANTQNSGLRAQAAIPSRAAANTNLLRGVGGVLKQPGVLTELGGLFGRGMDWLGNTTGLWGGPELLNSFGDWEL